MNIGLVSGLVVVSTVPSGLMVSCSNLGLMGGVRMGSAISSIAMDAAAAPGQDWVPTNLANLLFVVINSAASLVDPKENKTFCSPAVGAE